MDSSQFNQAGLQDFLEHEKQKAMITEAVSKITSICWDKCITGTPGSKFNSSEASCLSNCAKRYMDMSKLVTEHVHGMGQGN